MSERISVVIPVLDDAALLELCLASLAGQDREPDEVIVVDNGCTDDSAAVARSFGARVVAEPRRGITSASAHGFDAASGTIIARCDADSVLPPTWLARIESQLSVHPDAVAVTGPGRFYNLRGVPGRLAEIFYIFGYFIVMHPLLGHPVLFGSNCAVRARVWRAVSGEVPRDDSEIHDDMDLSYRLPAASQVLFDRRLVVGISARPFESWPVFARRLKRAAHTFSLHLPEQLPHRRWLARWQLLTAPPLTPLREGKP